MPLEEEKVAETRAWLVRAAMDLRAAEHERNADPPITSDMVFHAQQLAEKAMKAFLTWHDQPFRKTHSLVELGGQCVDVDLGLEPLLRRAAPLSEYAWKFRYPGDPEEPALEEAEGALAIASEVYRGILEKLPDRVRP